MPAIHARSSIRRRRAAAYVLAAALALSACGGEDLLAPPGEIRVTTATTGELPDPDGYTLSLDGGTPERIGASATLGLPADAGEHVVELGDVDPPCALAGEARRRVTVEPGGLAEIAYAVLCQANEGVVVVTTVTTGPLQDVDGYTVAIAGGEPQPIGANATLTVEHLEPGSYTVALAGLAANCGLESTNPVTVTVAPGVPAIAEFRVACRAGVARWSPMTSGTVADLTTVWADPATGVGFAGGERDVSRGVEGVLLAYDGSRWDVTLREADFRVRGVWGSGPDDVYAVGYGFLTGGIRVFRYDGTDWAPVDGFDTLPDEDPGFESVWGTGPSDVWAVGSSFRSPFGESLIFHFNGSAWERVFVGGEFTPTLNDVYGVSPTEVYAVGRDQFASPAVGVVLRYDGGAWTSVLEVEDLSLNAVWAASSRDVYVAGFRVEERDDEFLVTGAIWRYDGATWAPVAIPEVGVLQEIWGTSATDIYAVGADGTVLHYDGRAWTATTEGTATLIGVWGGAAGEVFAVGLGGTILRGTP